MTREEVARHQRTRLYGAMIEAVHERGYQETTVRQVVTLAGVSNRAFYEQFANKEECFLATHDIVVARARKIALDACERDGGWANRLHAAVKALLDDIASSPHGPRLVLVDSLGVGPRARDRMVLAAVTFERVLATALIAHPHDDTPPPLIIRAIVAGIRHVAFTRVYEKREDELHTLADDVVDWIECYRSPGATRLSVSPQPEVAENRPAAFLMLEDRRSRVLGTLVYLTLDKGYSELDDVQIAQASDISIGEFHSLFATKQACFLAVLDEFVAEAMEAVTSAVAGTSSWPDTVRLALGALLEFFATHEALSRLAFIDIFEVGPGIIGRMMRPIEEPINLLHNLGPEPRCAPALTREAVIGAVWGIVSSYAAADRLRQLPRLVEPLTFVVLAPYLGPDLALRASGRDAFPDAAE